MARDLVQWLRRILGLPRLGVGTAIAGFLFFFVVLPLLGPAVEAIVGKLAPGDDWPQVLLRAALFGSIVLGTGLLWYAMISATHVLRAQRLRGFRNPPKVKCLVMLASDGVPDEQFECDLLACKTRDQAFLLLSDLDRLAPAKATWLQFVARAAEYHWPRLEELHLVFTRDDGLGADGTKRQRLARMLEHYLALRTPTAELEAGRSLEWIEVRNHFDVEATRQVLDQFQAQRHFEPEDTVYDLTGGTKGMTAGMMLACLDDDQQLEYFYQLTTSKDRLAAAKAGRDWFDSPKRAAGRPAPNALDVAWGVLPIEQTIDPAAPGGLLPVQVDTEAAVVMARAGN